MQRKLGLLKVYILISSYYITNQKVIEKIQDINFQNEAILFVKTFLIHTSRAQILPVKHIFQNASQE